MPMQRRFASTDIIHVDKIAFKDGKELEDKDIVFFDHFIIVANTDSAPDFYNIDTVKVLYGGDASQNNKQSTTYSNNRNIWF